MSTSGIILKARRAASEAARQKWYQATRQLVQNAEYLKSKADDLLKERDNLERESEVAANVWATEGNPMSEDEKKAFYEASLTTDAALFEWKFAAELGETALRQLAWMAFGEPECGVGLGQCKSEEEEQVADMLYQGAPLGEVFEYVDQAIEKEDVDWKEGF